MAPLTAQSTGDWEEERHGALGKKIYTTLSKRNGRSSLFFLERVTTHAIFAIDFFLVPIKNSLKKQKGNRDAPLAWPGAVLKGESHQVPAADYILGSSSAQRPGVLMKPETGLTIRMAIP